jgi:hypothetical protein
MTFETATLSLGMLGGRVGAGVRVAMIDSGVHEGHPHAGRTAAGAAFDTSGAPRGDTIDRLGHGTAVASVIREKAPAAELVAVKVFDRSLATTGPALVAAVRWAAAGRADILNLSLGTDNNDHEQDLAEAVGLALARGVVVVAAAPEPGRRWLPGALPGVVAVRVDWSVPRDECVWRRAGANWLVRASGYPRPIPGVSPERNLKGVSFAVANVSGLVARALDRGHDGPPLPLLSALVAGSARPEA